MSENAELRAFLSEIKLERHLEVMERLGYDDVNDFENFNAESLAILRRVLAEQDVPDGHIDRIVRHVAKRGETTSEKAAVKLIQPEHVVLQGVVVGHCQPMTVAHPTTPSVPVHITPMQVAAAPQTTADAVVADSDMVNSQPVAHAQQTPVPIEKPSAPMPPVMARDSYYDFINGKPPVIAAPTAPVMARDSNDELNRDLTVKPQGGGESWDKRSFYWPHWKLYNEDWEYWRHYDVPNCLKCVRVVCCITGIPICCCIAPEELCAHTPNVKDGSGMKARDRVCANVWECWECCGKMLFPD
mmetsp:Transcript_69968/g.116198  ORF Transcript_69968/g.116198 Transcript_69968/m.116198 type:complete len:300 (+) Transcript_69968:116-1015(+)|eukprot:CAMPEP_0119333696 /NCGR_PEP_ID=MMETSP1333-20130426/85751_1 /TAXON_ID=418940 /ORGANISM="Scyphosphaera apsteinii, Strain RCC1455" /LENGTH=299 /DNA_ID=CAMNT_0007343829 /DNA_START=135 /DNA_END=1034 /DNA_ORIENTATION=+